MDGPFVQGGNESRKCKTHSRRCQGHHCRSSGNGLHQLTAIPGGGKGPSGVGGADEDKAEEKERREDDLVCRTSCIELSSVQITSLKESVRNALRGKVQTLLLVGFQDHWASSGSDNDPLQLHPQKSPNCRCRNPCVEFPVSSLSSSSILSMYSAISFVMDDSWPDLRRSSSPSPLVQAKIRRFTVREVVQIPSWASSLTIAAGVLPCCHIRMILSWA